MTNEERRVMKKKVCLIGDSRVGKTSLIKRFVNDEFDDKYIATIGAKISKKDVEVKLKNKNLDYHVAITLTIWDLIGHLTPLIRRYSNHYWDGDWRVVQKVRDEKLNNALIFVTSAYESAYSQNYPQFNGNIVYARNLPNKSQLMNQYPERDYYIEKNFQLLPINETREKLKILKMSVGIDFNTNTPIIKDIFTADEKIMVSVEFEKNNSPIPLIFKWYDPENKIYFTSAPFWIPPQNTGLWSHLEKLQNLKSGKWKVVGISYKEKIGEKYFVIRK